MSTQQEKDRDYARLEVVIRTSPGISFRELRCYWFKDWSIYRFVRRWAKLNAKRQFEVRGPISDMRMFWIE